MLLRDEEGDGSDERVSRGVTESMPSENGSLEGVLLQGDAAFSRTTRRIGKRLAGGAPRRTQGQKRKRTGEQEKAQCTIGMHCHSVMAVECGVVDGDAGGKGRQRWIERNEVVGGRNRNMMMKGEKQRKKEGVEGNEPGGSYTHLNQTACRSKIDSERAVLSPTIMSGSYYCLHHVLKSVLARLPASRQNDVAHARRIRQQPTRKKKCFSSSVGGLIRLDHCCRC